MFALKGEFLHAHGKRGIEECESLFVNAVCGQCWRAFCRGCQLHGVLLGFGMSARPQGTQPGVVCADDEVVGFRLTGRDVPFGIAISLDIAVTVEVVWRDVQQDGHVRTEVCGVLELKAGSLDDPDGVVALGPSLCFCYRTGETGPDVAGTARVNSACAQQMVQQCGGGRFAIRSGDRCDACVRVPACKFKLTNDLDSCFAGPPNGGCISGNSR